MKVNHSIANPALVSLIRDPSQLITLDANFLIPPDRSRICKRNFSYSLFKDVWLDPIFEIFPNLAIHEAVYDELVVPKIRNYVDLMLSWNPPRLIIHRDSALSITEKILRDSIENKIYPLTNYDPNLDNKDDRGEVKSLSYIAVKGLLYFAAHDNTALQLIENACTWSTGLDNVQAIHMYELIYYFFSNHLAEKDALKILYKYQYHLTNREKATNPMWGEFIWIMGTLYS